MTEQNGYDATRDPRTGRPVLPLDGEKNKDRYADAVSEPLGDEDNQGIAMGEEEDLTSMSEEADGFTANSYREDGTQSPSSEEINSTVPRMAAAAPFSEQGDTDIRSEEVDDLIGEPNFDEDTTEGERPEALAKFAEVARNHDGQPVRSGVEASSDTAPIPTDPSLKQEAATRVLREGVFEQDQGADEAIDKLPDRTDLPGRRLKPD